MTAATAKNTHNWMKEKGYEEMWILPEMDIFTSNPVLKCYRSCPPGNIPELFNLDYCLNRVLHKAVYCRVRYTHS